MRGNLLKKKIQQRKGQRKIRQNKDSFCPNKGNINIDDQNKVLQGTSKDKTRLRGHKVNFSGRNLSNVHE